jgi:hypothetical protein
MPMYALIPTLQDHDHATDTPTQVSGLKEHLNLKGNQYSILLAMFTAGYAMR